MSLPDLPLPTPGQRNWAQPLNESLEALNDALESIPTDAELEAAVTATETARDQAQTYAANTQELQDAAVAGLITDPDSETATQLSATFVGAQQLVVDARRFGVVADGVTDDTESLRAAAEAARSLVNLSGKCVLIQLPAGRIRITGRIGALVGENYEPTTKVSWRGYGIGVTILAPEGNGYSPFHRAGGADRVLEDTHWEDFEIDGTGYATPPTYNAEFTKGIFIQYMLRPVFRNLYIHDCGATGLGVDYLQDYLIENVFAHRNGRFYSGNFTGNIGASGIGIGTGRYEVEAGVIANCRAFDNMNHGIFWEHQAGTTYSRGMVAVGCIATGNHQNFAEKRTVDAMFVNCVSEGAVTDGVYMNAGGRWHGGLVRGNGTNGIQLVRQYPEFEPAWVGGDAEIYDNAEYGVRQRVVTAALGISEFGNMRVHHNGKSGVFVEHTVGSSTIPTLRVGSGFRGWDNGTARESNRRSAVTCIAPVDRLVVSGAQFWDTGGGDQERAVHFPDSGDVVSNADIQHNSVNGFAYNPFIIQNAASAATARIRENIGFVTQGFGAGTIADGYQTAVITHGLYAAPKSVTVTPRALGAEIAVTLVTSTTFTVSRPSGATSGDLPFYWQAVM